MDEELRKGLGVMLIVLAVFMSLSIVQETHAQQTGASVVNVSHTEKVTASPGSRNDSKGAIHTIRLTSEQQNTKWKAYVGNVSTTFVLDDADDYSIYRWDVTSFSGQVYITRNDSITWTTVGCASIPNKTYEDSQINHVSTAEDSVNSTFKTQIHRGFSVGTSSIAADQCYSTVLFQNDTQPTHTSGTVFEELLLWDNTTDSMIYTVFVENGQYGYRNITQNASYDFQAIVPDDATASNPPLRYYFYMELS